MAKEKSTFRVQVSGGEELQKLYKKLDLKSGMAVELDPNEKDNKIYVLFKKKGLFSKKYKNLGFLTRSEDFLYQLKKGHKILNPQVAGFYDEDWGHQLILQITVDRNV
jgi:hypothetical protein